MPSVRFVQAGSGKSEVVQVHGESSMNLAGSWLWGKGGMGRKLIGLGGLTLFKLVVQVV